MNRWLTARKLLNIGGALTGGLVALTLLVLVVNLSWFDEPLHPELVSLRTPQPVSMQDNSYPLVLAFLAADERDPRVAGQEIIEGLRKRYEQGQRIALGSQEMEVILGGSNLDDSWQAPFKALACNARVSLDCAERLIAEVAEAGSQHPRLSVLLERYERILSHTRFEQNPARDVFSPVAPYRPLMNVGRLRLAMSYGRDSTTEFLSKAAEDLDFWITVLRESQTLAAKMVSLAGMQNNLDFLSTLMRNRELDDSDLGFIQRFLRSLTSEERDIGEAFLSEARIAALSETPPIVMSASWATRLMLQENATLNEEYLTVLMPMRLRASLSAEEYYRQGAYEELSYDLRAFPPPVFNLGGKLARRAAWRSGPEYVARVHDQNGRISLVLLQAEIERDRGSAVEDLIRSSVHRNPYTDEPMKYDAQAQTIGFQCLHSVFHPPNPPDVCSIAIAAR